MTLCFWPQNLGAQSPGSPSPAARVWGSNWSCQVLQLTYNSMAFLLCSIHGTEWSMKRTFRTQNPGDRRTPGTIASSTTHWQGATCGWRLKSAGLDIAKKTQTIVKHFHFFVILNSCPGIRGPFAKRTSCIPCCHLVGYLGAWDFMDCVKPERSQVSCHIRSLCVKRRCSRLKRCVHKIIPSNLIPSSLKKQSMSCFYSMCLWQLTKNPLPKLHRQKGCCLSSNFCVEKASLSPNWQWPRQQQREAVHLSQWKSALQQLDL